MIYKILEPILITLILFGIYFFSYKEVKKYPIQTQIKFIFIISFLIEIVEVILSALGIHLIE